jgi:hypothetical protein
MEANGHLHIDIYIYIYIYLFIFNCNWVDTRWQQYITHLQTNNTHNTEKGKKKGKTHNTEKGKGKCVPCFVFASYTLAFALQLRKKHGKTSVRVAPTALPLRKEPPYPLNRRLDGPRA